MPRPRRSVSRLLFTAAVFSLGGVASATTYTDATGTDHFSGPEVDISSVVITNDAFDLHVTINMNTAANLTTNYYGAYEMGIQVNGGAGGQTAINSNYNLGDPTAGDPYGSTVGISTGENFFIGAELAEPTGNTTGGATLYQYSSTAGWSNIYTTYTDQARFTEVPTGTPSISYYFPLSSFGFTAGSTFNFDVWTTFTTNPSGQGAYDALDNPGIPNGSTATPWTGQPYDSATASGSTFSTTTYTVVSSTVNGVWNVDGGGSWNNASNWTSAGVPNGPGSTATFGSVLDSGGNPPAIVTVDASQTVGQITFNDTYSYSITTTNSSNLTINDTGDSNGVKPTISVMAGSHSIGVPIFLSAGVTLSTAASTSLSISGTVSGAGPVTVSGGGSVTLGGINTYTGNTNVSAGSLTLGAVGSLPSGTNLTIGTGAIVVAANLGTASRIVVDVAGLTITGTGKLDLTDNDMIVQAAGETGYGTINSEVATGRGSNGLWTGNGITSSAAQATAAGSAKNTALAVVINDTNQNPSGSLSSTPLVQAGSPFNNGLTTFDGQAVNDGDVLVKYTYYGDALLTGSVTAADYTQIDNGFNSGGMLKGWYNGDFNYDGVINGDDYTLIDNAYNTQNGVSLAGISTGTGPAEMIAGDTEQVAVPEPAISSLFAIGCGLLLRRRRKM